MIKISFKNNDLNNPKWNLNNDNCYKISINEGISEINKAKRKKTLDMILKMCKD